MLRSLEIVYILRQEKIIVKIMEMEKVMWSKAKFIKIRKKKILCGGLMGKFILEDGKLEIKVPMKIKMINK